MDYIELASEELEKANAAAGFYDAVRDEEVDIMKLTKEQQALVLSEAQRRLDTARSIIAYLTQYK